MIKVTSFAVRLVMWPFHWTSSQKWNKDQCSSSDPDTHIWPVIMRAYRSTVVLESKTKGVTSYLAESAINREPCLNYPGCSPRTSRFRLAQSAKSGMRGPMGRPVPPSPMKIVFPGPRKYCWHGIAAMPAISVFIMYTALIYSNHRAVWVRHCTCRAKFWSNFKGSFIRLTGNFQGAFI